MLEEKNQPKINGIMHIQDLSKTDLDILYVLLTSIRNNTAYNISRKINMSLSNTHLRLRILVDNGIVLKNRLPGSPNIYILKPNVRGDVQDALFLLDYEVIKGDEKNENTRKDNG